jgi:hypothetical protein
LIIDFISLSEPSVLFLSSCGESLIVWQQDGYKGVMPIAHSEAQVWYAWKPTYHVTDLLFRNTSVHKNFELSLKRPLLFLQFVLNMYVNFSFDLVDWEYSRRDPSRWPRDTLYPQKVVTNFADEHRSVSIVCLRNEATQFFMSISVWKTSMWPCKIKFCISHHGYQPGHNHNLSKLAILVWSIHLASIYINHILSRKNLDGECYKKHCVHRIPNYYHMHLFDNEIHFNRFPTPDLRPIHDMDRPSWWKRSVRKDFLVFELSDASFNSTIDSQEPCRRFEIQCRDINGLFQVSLL